MKKLSLLLLVCMVSVLAFAQTDSPADSVGGLPNSDSAGGVMPQQSSASPLSAVGNDSASDNNLPASDGVTLAPSSISDLGNQPIGFKAVTPFTLTNRGSNNITITNVVVSASGPYSIYDNHCAGQLQIGNSCTILVAFQASAVGQSSAMLTVDYENGSDQGTQTATLIANGMYDVVLSPLMGCNTNIGQEHLHPGPCTILLVNQEPNPLKIASFQVSTQDNFHITSNNCPMEPERLQAFSSCAIVVQYFWFEGQQGTLNVITNPQNLAPPPLSLHGCRGRGYTC